MPATGMIVCNRPHVDVHDTITQSSEAGFDEHFVPSDATDRECTSVLPVDALQPRGTPRSGAVVVTIYCDNVPLEVVARQAEVIHRFLPPGCEFVQLRASHHALGLDDYFRVLHHDAYVILDIDCIPLTPWAIVWMLENAHAGIIVGAAQRANHLENDGHLYAGPCALAFSRETFERLGCPSFKETPRADVAEELTHACEEAGIPVSLLWPTHVTTPKWTLQAGIQFGLGTTFGGAFYHAFEIRHGQTVKMFLQKCDEVLAGSSGSGHNFASVISGVGCGQSIPHSTQPTFHEMWYSEVELALLEGAVRFIRPLPGEIIELGCWEGRSTAVIAKACSPEPVLAVDTWEGSFTEGETHCTVQIARERDVFAIFQENMSQLGYRNVIPKRMDIQAFLREGQGPIKFCHVDAAHDYPSVKESLQLVLPRLVEGGILFGHDYENANIGRADLQGGVQRAVQELLPRHAARGNNWWYVHTK
jgi:predicted O-methyltransferase YrrM